MTRSARMGSHQIGVRGAHSLLLVCGALADARAHRLPPPRSSSRTACRFRSAGGQHGADPAGVLRRAACRPKRSTPWPTPARSRARSRRCAAFEAELVMSQSSAPAGLAWYNVPAIRTRAPSAIYPVLTETTTPARRFRAPRSAKMPNYAGGLIGFRADEVRRQPSTTRRPRATPSAPRARCPDTGR